MIAHGAPYSHSIVPQHRNPAQLLKFSKLLPKITVTGTDRTFRLEPIDRDGCRKHPVATGPLPQNPAASTSLCPSNLAVRRRDATPGIAHTSTQRSSSSSRYGGSSP